MNVKMNFISLKKLALMTALAGILAGCSDDQNSLVDADDAVAAAATDVSVDWHLDFEEASALAKAEGKFMLLEFHGSDWCPPCIKLKKEVLTQPAFKQYASENLVLVDLDFPRRTELSDEQKAHNQELAMRFGVQYFPTVILMSPDGEVLDQSVGFPSGGLNGFLEFIRKQVGS
jgi:thioredoxin-related protein